MSLRTRIGGGPVAVSVTNPAAAPFRVGSRLLGADLYRVTARQSAQLDAARFLSPWQVAPVSVNEPLVRSTAGRTLAPIRQAAAGFRRPYVVPPPPGSPVADRPSSTAIPAPAPCAGC